MKLAIFSSADDLVSYFSDVGAAVGPRKGPDKRTQDQKELYNLRQYLPTLAINGLLSFPLSVEKGESPDFLLTDAKAGTWGLEVTEATTKDWQRELTMTEGAESSLVGLGRDGWAGNSAERETCAAILRAMRRKARKIRAGGYRSVSRYDVLIYVNVRAFFYNADDAVNLLVQRAIRWNAQWAGLGRVEVLTSLRLYSDITGDRNRLTLFRYAADE